MVYCLPRTLLFQASDSIPCSIFSALISCETEKTVGDCSVKWQLGFQRIWMNIRKCLRWSRSEWLMKAMALIMMVTVSVLSVWLLLAVKWKDLESPSRQDSQQPCELPRLVIYWVYLWGTVLIGLDEVERPTLNMGSSISELKFWTKLSTVIHSSLHLHFSCHGIFSSSCSHDSPASIMKNYNLNLWTKINHSTLRLLLLRYFLQQEGKNLVE